jgi:hypothetical protein
VKIEESQPKTLSEARGLLRTLAEEKAKKLGVSVEQVLEDWKARANGETGTLPGITPAASSTEPLEALSEPLIGEEISIVNGQAMALRDGRLIPVIAPEQTARFKALEAQLKTETDSRERYRIAAALSELRGRFYGKKKD